MKNAADSAHLENAALWEIASGVRSPSATENAHLADCGACAAGGRDAATALAAVAAPPDLGERLPGSFWLAQQARIQARLRASGAGHGERGRLAPARMWRWSVVSAGTLALCGGIYLGSRGVSSRPPLAAAPPTATAVPAAPEEQLLADITAMTGSESLDAEIEALLGDDAAPDPFAPLDALVELPEDAG